MSARARAHPPHAPHAPRWCTRLARANRLPRARTSQGRVHGWDNVEVNEVRRAWSGPSHEEGYEAVEAWGGGPGAGGGGGRVGGGASAGAEATSAAGPAPGCGGCTGLKTQTENTSKSRPPRGTLSVERERSSASGWLRLGHDKKRDRDVQRWGGRPQRRWALMRERSRRARAAGTQRAAAPHRSRRTLLRDERAGTRRSAATPASPAPPAAPRGRGSRGQGGSAYSSASCGSDHAPSERPAVSLSGEAHGLRRRLAGAATIAAVSLCACCLCRLLCVRVCVPHQWAHFHAAHGRRARRACARARSSAPRPPLRHPPPPRAPRAPSSSPATSS